MGKRKETEIFTREDADRLLEAAENRDAVTVPEGVTVIDRHAFSGRAEIRRVTLPETVTAILDGIRLPFGLENMERWWNDGDVERWGRFFLFHFEKWNKKNRPHRSTFGFTI